METIIKTRFLFEKGELLEDRFVHLNGGIITAISEVLDERNKANAEVFLISPGFRDLQVNGGGGVLLNKSPSAEGVMTILNAHQKLGTSAILPTVITDKAEVIDRAANAVIETFDEPGVLGIHIEGPHINPLRKGTHDVKFIRSFDKLTLNTLERLRKASIPVILTLAPELMQKHDFEMLVEMDVKIFAGHSEASFDESNKAIQRGLTGFTHLFNAMPQMTSRCPGIIASALLSDRYCGMIADGIHVSFAMLKLAIQSRGVKDRMFFVSDAMPTVGGTPSFKLYDQVIKVENGRLVNSEGALAGAHIDMLTSFQNLVQNLALDLKTALRMGITTPGLILGMNEESLIGKASPEFMMLDEALNLIRSNG